MEQSAYPVTFSVDYPDRQLNRLSTLLRILFAIPILILLSTLVGSNPGWREGEGAGAFATGGGILFLAPLLMIVVRQKYPRWWFDWNLNIQRFINRIWVYIALMDDRYPSTDEEQSVHLDLPYPTVGQDVSRWLPLVKWFLAIPHYIVLIFLIIAAVIIVIISWFAILFTGRYPRSLFDFVEGVFRWSNRVTGYAFVLVTDKYPPFRLGA